MPEERKKQQLHLYADEKEWQEITAGLDAACITDMGKIRSGDLLRSILLHFVKQNKKK